MRELEQVRKLKEERDALQARVQELEAQAIAMREALEASEHFESLLSGAAYALANRDSAMAEAYRTEAERARGEAERLRAIAIAADAGWKTFERLLQLEHECREWRSLLAAIARQSGGTVRVGRAAIMELPPDIELEVSSSDEMHTETIIRLVDKS